MGEVASPAVVVGVAAVVLAVAAGWRTARGLRHRRLPDTGLPAGIYLLTSSDCQTCGRARRRLERRRVGFHELSWQENGDVLRRLGIDAVPSVLVVEADGDARWYRGGVPPRLGNPPRERGGG